MAEGYMADLVAVFGYPVAENPTCVMQEAAFAAGGLHWKYLTIEVKPEALPDAVRGARAMGFKGFNCTIPHKVAVIPLLDEVSPDAAMIGAVNTVRLHNGKFIGENTDGKGFLRGVREEANIDPKGKRIIILGAGGAARAIAVELALAGAAAIHIYNRSEERGVRMFNELDSRIAVHQMISKGKSQGYLTYKELNEKLPADQIHPDRLDALMHKFQSEGIELREASESDMRIWAPASHRSFHLWRGTISVPPDTDILVNATSIGLFPDLDAMPEVSLDSANPNLLVADVIPNPPDTRLIKLARARGLKTLNGLAMLVYQGAIGFKMWTGQDPSEPAMKATLEQAFGIR
jgi:shikimate dehydrogenase